MFTSIPVIEVIDTATSAFSTRLGRHGPLIAEDVKRLLIALLKESFFTFEGKVYRQISGLPMGSRVSGVLASLFVDRLERQAVTGLQLTAYSRYVDVVFLLTSGPEEAERILSRFNCMHPKLVFKMEKPDSENKLCLLDVGVRVTNAGLLFFSFYRKEAASDVMVHYRSSLPSSTKACVVRNEVQRIRSRCLLLLQLLYP